MISLSSPGKAPLRTPMMTTFQATAMCLLPTVLGCSFVFLMAFLVPTPTCPTSLLHAVRPDATGMTASTTTVVADSMITAPVMAPAMEDFNGESEPVDNDTARQPVGNGALIAVVSVGSPPAATPAASLAADVHAALHTAGVQEYRRRHAAHVKLAVRYDKQNCCEWLGRLRRNLGGVEWWVFVPSYYLVGDGAQLHSAIPSGAVGFDAFVSLTPGQPGDEGDILWLNASSLAAAQAIDDVLKTCSDGNVPLVAMILAALGFEKARVGDIAAGSRVDCQTRPRENMDPLTNDGVTERFPYNQPLMSFPNMDCGLPFLHASLFVRRHCAGLTNTTVISGPNATVTLLAEVGQISTRSVVRMQLLRNFAMSRGIDLNVMPKGGNLQAARDELFKKYEWVWWIHRDAFVAQGRGIVDDLLRNAEGLPVITVDGPKPISIATHRSHAKHLSHLHAHRFKSSYASYRVLAAIPKKSREKTGRRTISWHRFEYKVLHAELSVAARNFPTSNAAPSWELATSIPDMPAAVPNHHNGVTLTAISEKGSIAACTSTKITLVSVMPSFRKGTYSRIVADLHLAHMEHLMASDRCLHRHEVVQCSSSTVDGETVHPGSPSELRALVTRQLGDSDVVVVVDSSVLFRGPAAVLDLVQKGTTASASVQLFVQRGVDAVAVVRPAFKAEHRRVASSAAVGCNDAAAISELLSNDGMRTSLPQRLGRVFAEADCSTKKAGRAKVTIHCNDATVALYNWYLEVMPRADTGAELLPHADDSDGPTALASLRAQARRVSSAAPRTSPGKKFGILSLYAAKKDTTAARISMWQASRWNKQQYGAKHGYDVIWEGNQMAVSGRTRHWDKVPAIAKWLPRYEWLWIVDVDTVILNASITLDSVVEEATKRNCGKVPVLVLGNERKGLLNTGSMLVRNTPEAFEFLRQSLIVGAERWYAAEQGAMNHLIMSNMAFSGPAVPKLGTVHTLRYEAKRTSYPWKCSASTPSFAAIVPMRLFNSIPQQWYLKGAQVVVLKPLDFVVHFMGYSGVINVGFATPLDYEKYMLLAASRNANFTRWPTRLPQ